MVQGLVWIYCFSSRLVTTFIRISEVLNVFSDVLEVEALKMCIDSKIEHYVVVCIFMFLIYDLVDAFKCFITVLDRNSNDLIVFQV